MRYKCHYCGDQLKPDKYFMLSCYNCNNCSISFAYDGSISIFDIKIFEQGHDWLITRSKYHTDTLVYRKDKKDYKLIVNGNFDLKFDQNGVLKVYDLWERLMKLQAFS